MGEPVERFELAPFDLMALGRTRCLPYSLGGEEVDWSQITFSLMEPVVGQIDGGALCENYQFELFGRFMLACQYLPNGRITTPLEGERIVVAFEGWNTFIETFENHFHDNLEEVNFWMASCQQSVNGDDDEEAVSKAAKDVAVYMTWLLCAKRGNTSPRYLTGLVALERELKPPPPDCFSASKIWPSRRGGSSSSASASLRPPFPMGPLSCKHLCELGQWPEQRPISSGDVEFFAEKGEVSIGSNIQLEAKGRLLFFCVAANICDQKTEKLLEWFENILNINNLEALNLWLHDIQHRVGKEDKGIAYDAVLYLLVFHGLLQEEWIKEDYQETLKNFDEAKIPQFTLSQIGKREREDGSEPESKRQRLA